MFFENKKKGRFDIMVMYDSGCDPYERRHGQECSDERIFLFKKLKKLLPAKKDVLLFYEEKTILDIKICSIVCIPKGMSSVFSLETSNVLPEIRLTGRFGCFGEVSLASIEKAIKELETP